MNLISKSKLFIRDFKIKLNQKLVEIFDKKPNGFLDIKNIKKVLFLRLDGKIGDYIVTSYFFREASKLLDIKTDIITTEKIAYIYEDNAYIAQKHLTKKNSLFYCIVMGIKLRKKYDLVITNSEFIKFKDLALIKFIGAPHNAGYKQALKIFDINISSDHMYEFSEDMLKILGAKNISTQYELPVVEKSAKESEIFLKEHSIDKFIAVNFFGASRARRMNAESMQKLTKNIKKTYPRIPVIILAYGGVMKYLEPFIKNNSDEDIVLFDSSTSVFNAFELLRKASLVISIDTSIAHFAVGLNKPLIVMGRSNGTQIWIPQRDNIRCFLADNNINNLDFESLDLKMTLP